MKFISLNYYCHHEYNKPEQVIKKHAPTDFFLQDFKEQAIILLVKHASFEGQYEQNDFRYLFFRRSNSFWQVPLRAHQKIKKEKPSVVVIQGFIFPIQVTALRLLLGSKVVIIVQHQGEVPYKKKRIFQKMADRCVDGYLFTSSANGKEWIDAGIIKTQEKCFEIPAATTLFQRKNKEQCLAKTGMSGDVNFLWVGRLNKIKDPLTVLLGFEKYVATSPAAMLYMIYQEDYMLNEVKGIIDNSNFLKDRVVLVGTINNAVLENWYSAADYFILGSRREGGSYALMEAMACGCVPIVSNIPASIKMIDNGKAGFYFKPGNADDLAVVLESLSKHNYETVSNNVVEHFKKEMSVKAIARKMVAICEKLQIKK